MSRLPVLAALAALLLIPLAHGQEPTPPPPPAPPTTLQQAIDQAPAGAALRVPPGVFNESLVIEKDLTLVGTPGLSLVDGGDEPAIVVRNASVNIDFLGLQSTGRALLVTDAPSMEIWSLAGNWTQPPRFERVGFLRLVLAPQAEPPPIEAVATTWVHAHPVGFGVLDANRQPVSGAVVRVFDGGRLVAELTTNLGLTPGYPVAHTWTSPSGSGTNQTSVEIDGVQGRYPVDPHAGQVVFTTNLGASGLPFRLNPLALAAAVALIAFALALELHEGFRWAWMNKFSGYYLRSAKKELASRPDAREAIARHIQDQPGSSLKDLRKGLKLGDGTLLEHLGRLEAEGRVKAVQEGRWRRHHSTAAPAEVPAEGTPPPAEGAPPPEGEVPAPRENP